MLFLIPFFFHQCTCYNIRNNLCTSLTHFEKAIPIYNQNINKLSNDLLFSNYNKLLIKAQESCDSNQTNLISCTFMTNYCLLNSESNDYCTRFRGISTNYSCIQYKQSYKEILRDVVIPQSFDYSTIVKIVVACFSPIGEFIGYFPLKNLIQNCGSRNYEGNIWKKFGHNYYEECSINVSKLSLNFYEPFLFIEDQDLLIQIPVLPTNYIQNGEKVNDKNGNINNYQFFNRFFMYDNYSHKKIQYASEISIIFNIQEENHKQIHIPYLVVTYENIHSTNEFQSFKFSSKYLLRNDAFKNLTIIIIIVSITLAIGYFMASFLVIMRTLASGVQCKYTLFSILNNLFDSIGYAFFFISSFLGFYILCGYKWTNHLYMCLESTNYYIFLHAFVFTSFFLKFIGTIFLVINQSNGKFFAIDWDQRSSKYNNNSKSKFISKLRQKIVANEWLKLSTVRGIDTSFIVLFVLLITRGCKMYLLQQPIPTTERIDVGKKYLIIEAGLTSFIWIITTFLFWIMKRFIYWNIFGNPFINFQHLCLSLNISVLMIKNNTRGFLINGKQIQRYSPDHLINSYDYQCDFDPEKNTDDYSEYSTFSDKKIDLSSNHQDNKAEQNTRKKKKEIRIFVNKSSNELEDKYVNNDLDHTEPQKVQVDANSINNIKLKKKQNLLKDSKNSRISIIDKDNKEIDNVGMENNGHDNLQNPEKQNKKGSNDNKKINSDSDDIDVDIDTNSDSDHQLNKTHKSDSSSESSENITTKHPQTIENAILEEEEEEVIDSTSEHKNINYTENCSNMKQNKITDDNSNNILINQIEVPNDIPSITNIFDSNVVNENETKASKEIKMFQFNPVNLLEDESENDINLSNSYSDLISDSHYSEISIPKEHSNTQNEITYNNDKNSQIKTEKKKIIDIIPKLDPLDKKFRGKNQVFEYFLEPDFYHFANKSEEIIDILIENKNNRIYSENTKTISELKEETNSTWSSILLNKESDFSYLIEAKSIAQTIFNIGPISIIKSVFTIQNDSSFKDSMIYGIEGSLILFYLILFVSIEMISNASIAGVVVFLVDTLILQFFKWKRKKYLIDRQYLLI